MTNTINNNPDRLIKKRSKTKKITSEISEDLFNITKIINFEEYSKELNKKEVLDSIKKNLFVFVKNSGIQEVLDLLNILKINPILLEAFKRNSDTEINKVKLSNQKTINELLITLEKYKK